MIYQLKVSLKDIQPEIWRRIHINPEASLYELHHTIQVLMNWDNYHLYQFVIANPGHRRRVRIGNPELLDDSEAIDDKTISINSILANEKETLDYEYDFGDNWRHIIKLEKIIHLGEIHFPKCIDGKRNTPPEDCGAIPGFYIFLDIMSDKKHKDYKETRRWYGGDYDPEFIDIPGINKDLSDLDNYIKEYEKDLEI